MEPGLSSNKEEATMLCGLQADPTPLGAAQDPVRHMGVSPSPLFTCPILSPLESAFLSPGLARDPNMLISKSTPCI